MIQTTMVDHGVVRAASVGEPSILADAEARRRAAMNMPPHAALAIVDGVGADEFAAALGRASGVATVPQRDRWLVRASDATILADALEATERPSDRAVRNCASRSIRHASDATDT